MRKRQRGRVKEREKKRETGKEKKMRASKSLSCIFIAHLTLNYPLTGF